LTDDGYLDSVSEDSPAEDISVLDVEIVVNHGGSIEAVPSEAEGARIVVERPL
jgi:hypothetical protein